MFLKNITQWFTGRSQPMGLRRLPMVCLQIEGLEAREVPAYVAAGNLEIVGSNAVDNVKVQDVTVNGVAKVRVTHNGVVQDFIASSISGRVRFWGYGSDDRFDYYGSKHIFADGGTGNDYLSSDRGADLLIGGAGNDWIYGYGGNDELQGGEGNDRLWAGSGNDLLFGQSGTDQLVGESGDDELQGGAGGDELWGQDGNDRLFGQAGFDFLLGGNGNDYLDGGGFNNVDGAWEGAAAWGGSGNDQFVNCPKYLAFDLVGHPRPIAPFTTSVSGEPGIQDFTVGDTRDALSAKNW